MIRTLTLILTVASGVAAMVVSSFGGFGPTVLAQQAEASAVITTPGSTEVLTINTGTIRILIEGKQTNGTVTVVEGVVEPGHCVNVHTHAYAESFYILEGTMTLETGSETRQLPAGEYVYVPEKMPHGFCNNGQTPFRNILTATPSGIETMFRRRAEEFRKTQAQPPVAPGPPVPLAEPARIEILPFQSMTKSDTAFLTGAREGQPSTLAAELRLPSTGTERVPAVVLLHGSTGANATHDRWVRELNGLGIATLLVDSFKGRGIENTAEDQGRLGQMAMVYDAYRALELLARDPRIDPARIGLFGNSRGGVAALYASVRRFGRMHAPTDAAFAVHISLYPPCTRQYIDDTAVTDRPVRIFHGTSDLIAPIERCRAYVKRLQAAGADVQLTEYEGAHHGFDGHRLPPTSGDQPGATAFTCDLYEMPAGRFINRDTGQEFTPKDECAKASRITGYHAGAHARLVEDVTRVLRQVFRIDPRP